MRCKNWTKRLTAVLFAGIFVLSACLTAPVSAAAKTVSEMQQEQKELEKKIAAAKKEIEAAQKEKAETDAYIQALTKRMDLLREQIDLLQNTIDDLQRQINEKENKIADLQVQIDEQQKQFDQKKDEYYQRLKVLYMSGGVSSLEVLLSSSDYSSLLTRAQLVSSVSKQDQAALETLVKVMEEIEAKKAEMEQDKAALEASKAEQDTAMTQLQSQKAALSDDMAKSEAAAASLQKTITDNEHTIDDSEDAQNALRDKINSILYPPSQGGGKIEIGDGVTVGSMVHPCPDRMYVSVYWPSYASGKWHGAVDFACGSSSPSIYAADGGVVVQAGWSNTGYGNYVMIYHANGLFTLYGHASRLYVSAGQTISRGQVIAQVGSTGNSSGNHLHFEVRYGDGSSNRKTYNPANYLPYL